MSPKKAIIILLILLLLTTMVFAFLYFNEKNKNNLNIKNNFLPISEVKKELTDEEKLQRVSEMQRQMKENRKARGVIELTDEEKLQRVSEMQRQMKEKQNNNL